MSLLINHKIILISSSVFKNVWLIPLFNIPFSVDNTFFLFWLFIHRLWPPAILPLICQIIDRKRKKYLEICNVWGLGGSYYSLESEFWYVNNVHLGGFDPSIHGKVLQLLIKQWWQWKFLSVACVFAAKLCNSLQLKTTSESGWWW